MAEFNWKLTKVNVKREHHFKRLVKKPLLTPPFETMEPTRNQFDGLFRANLPDYYVNVIQAAREVASTDNAADESNPTSSNTKASKWKYDIFGYPDTFSPLGYLIPNSVVQASLYDDVVTWALGLTPENLANDPNSPLSEEAIWIIKQRIIHGVKPVEGVEEIPFKGIKHSPYNKIRLKGHKEYLDNRPCVVIVPTLSLEQVKAWDGEGYSAVVLASEWEGAPIAHVCRGIGMIDLGPLANADEFELARKLLEQVLCGLAFSLFRDRPFLTEKSAALLSKLRSNFSVPGRIKVPARINGGPVFPPIRKVPFGHEEGQHPPPDPLLLAVRAAVVWSKQNGEQLLPSGEGTRGRRS